MKKVLEHKNIVITRTAEQSKEATALLEDLGANVINFPTIKITATSNPIVDKTINNIASFNTIIFTSENAIKFFLLKINELNLKFEPNKFYIISIGEKTSEYCKQENIQINFQPKLFSWSSLLNELKHSDFSDKNILIPCSYLAETNKYKQIESIGARVTALPIYNNVINNIKNLSHLISLLQKTRIDVYIFTSPSTFRSFLKILNISDPIKFFKNKNIAVIGPVTKKALNDVGVSPNIIPENYSMPYIVKAIKSFYKNKE